MKCYYHPDVDAVGICKNCNKGICRDCTIDLGKGIACKDTCVDDVKAINALIENNRKAYWTLKPRSYIMPIFFLIMGIIFLVFGIKDSMYLSLYMGIIFIALAIISVIATAKLIKKLHQVK